MSRRYQHKRDRDRDRRWGVLMLDETDPDHWIYPMPTVEEVVAAGYDAGYHAAVERERAELVKRFREDPEWRAEYIRRRREDAEDRR